MEVSKRDIAAFERLIEKYGLRNLGPLSEFLATCGVRLPRARKIPDGAAGRSLFNRWRGMHSRCYDPKVKIFKHYGGRGIKVCARWHDFYAFLDDMGYPSPGLSLDRIDVNGDYSPENCRWATQSVQVMNRRPQQKKVTPGMLKTFAEMDAWVNSRHG